MQVAEVKRVAAGRWLEILTTLGGLSAEVLDGKHHPCPKCGGTDRFRMIDKAAGAVLCNQCFNQGNGDGFAALQWATGRGFNDVVKMLGDYLGVASGNGRAGGNGRVTATTKPAAATVKPVDFATQVKPLKAAVDPAVRDRLLKTFADAKPPISVEVLKQCNARLVLWSGHQCIALAGRNPIGAEKPTAVLLYRVEAIDFPAVGRLIRRKIHLLKGSKNAWIASRSAAEVSAATTIVRTEGPSDMLAAVSVGLPAGWAAVTNTTGAKSTGGLDFSFCTGKRVVVVGDADQPGQDGAQRFAAEFAKAGAADVRVGALPYDVTPDHGRDLRDYFADGHTMGDFSALVEAAVPVTPEQVEAWSKTATPGTRPKPEGTSCISNAVTVQVGEESQTLPIPMASVVKTILAATDNWPKRVGNALFVCDGGDVHWLDSSTALFGWLAETTGVIEWSRVSGAVNKDEVFTTLRRKAESHLGIEAYPHTPRLAKHFYTCLDPKPGDGKLLNALLDRFCFSTPIDRELARAAIATLGWGGAPGTRPAFMVTARSGRGRGKTKLCQCAASLFGGFIDVSANDDIGSIKTRLLSPEAATKRVAMLDNVKTSRFSWGELESLLTADTISGKKLYQGEGARPNYLTWFITLNGASLSTDMSQRVVEIQLANPDYKPAWEEETRALIEANREAIFGDIAALLTADARPLASPTRWATWERDVLAKVAEHPGECLTRISERRASADVEVEEADIIESHFSTELLRLEYDPERDDVFIPNSVICQWLNKATGERHRTTGASRLLRQYIEEGRLPRIQPDRYGPNNDRGFRWVGEHCDSGTITKGDLMRRLAKFGQDKHPDTTDTSDTFS